MSANSDQSRDSKSDLETNSTASDHVADRRRLISRVVKDYDGLVKLLRAKLQDRELANDLINEAIAITLEHVHEGRISDANSIGGYVFTVGMNLLRNHNRKYDNRKELKVTEDTLMTFEISEPEQLEMEQIRAKARQVLESLSSSRDREVVQRFYLNEENKEDICQSLGLTLAQFSQITSRARKRMKEIFDAEGVKRSDFFCIAI